MDEEADIVINGHKLTNSQAMTLRVAISLFVSEMSEPKALGDDEHGRFMTKAYFENVKEIEGLIFLAFKNCSDNG